MKKNSRVNSAGISLIYVDSSAQNDALTSDVISAHRSARIKLIPSGDDPSEHLPAETDSKTVLYITRSKGSLVKPCPGTSSAYICCGYQVINQTLNCPLRCSYCILQYYLNQPFTVIYTDYQTIFHDIQCQVSDNPRRFFRFGTGELGDSLALPGSRLFAKEAIVFFAGLKNAILELKTKTSHIRELLELPHNGRTILAWSLNPSEVIELEEHGSARLTARLKAARQAQEAGFLVSFHFDPLILFPDYTEAYIRLVRELYQYIDPTRIAWISLGSFRFPPAVKTQMKTRHPSSKLIYGEMVRGMDQKMRYPRPMRVGLYRRIYEILMDTETPPWIYFCMESRIVWEEVTGRAPASSAELDFWFATSLAHRFPELVPFIPAVADYQTT